MTRVSVIASALVLAVLTVLGTQATAQQTNVSERTFLTFSNTVEMPGLTLQPGTYVFKLADTPTRNVVQVWDQDERNMLGQWLYVQAERPEVTEETVVMFRETPEGTTPAVQYWYFPGERIGKEFIYPRDQAERIAARTGVEVRTEEGVVGGAAVAADTTIDSAPAAAQPSAPAGSLAGSRGADVDADAELRADADFDRAGVAAEAQITPDDQIALDIDADRPVGTAGQFEGQFASELPRTASPLALTGLLGLLSLLGAAGIRAVRK